MKRRGLRVLLMVVMGAAAIVAFSAVTMLLWNWLMPTILGLKAITYCQALGLLVLARILFGGMCGHRGRGMMMHGRHHHNELREKWMQMTPEQREELIKKRRGHHAFWGHHCCCDNESEQVKEEQK